MNEVRCVVTGAQGFIGRWLVAGLLGQGATVLGLGRSPRDDDSFTHTVTWNGAARRAPLLPELRSSLRHPNFDYVSLDLLDANALSSWLRNWRPDVVFHLAGSLRDESSGDLWRNNVLATEHLVTSAAGGDRPPRLVLGSSGIIGADPTGTRLPLADDAPAHPLDTYAISKHAAEQVARMLGRRHGVPVVVGRIFNVVGPGQEERHVCGRLARQFAEIEAGCRPREIEVGALEPTRDFVDVRDVAAALMTLAQSGRPGEIYNVATGIETSVQEVLDRLAGIAGFEPALRHTSHRAADVARHVADVSRLRSLGHTSGFPLGRSLEDVLDYYRSFVANFNGRPPEEGLAVVRLPRVVVERRDAYTVIVEPGALGRLPETLRPRSGTRRFIVLTDATVYELHVGEMIRSAAARDCGWDVVIAPSGEQAKTLEVHREVIERLFELGHDRRGCLVCIGGGAILDLGGFVAATFMRGTGYVNVPTTLVAMHDAAIGGKVAVNAPWAKNFIGAFHHPERVVCDPNVLGTLPTRMMAAGIAEALKVAIIGDAVLFDDLVRLHDAVMNRDPRVLQDLVCRAAAVKIQYLAHDPLETDLRRPLNLGHTFGHPLETHLGPDGISHGEAVAMGMIVATRVAEDRGTCSREVAARIEHALACYGLPPRIPASDLKAALAHLRAVRLVRGGKLNFVLPKEIGCVEIVDDLPVADLERACERTSADSTAV